MSDVESLLNIITWFGGKIKKKSDKKHTDSESLPRLKQTFTVSLNLPELPENMEIAEISITYAIRPKGA